MAFQTVQALKAFGNVCPFLHRVSVPGLRALSSLTTVDGHSKLGLLATTACPMMGAALANKNNSKSFSTSTYSAAAQKPASAPAPHILSPSSAASTSRGYASIAEQQAESAKLQRATAEEILARATSAHPSSASTPAGVAAPQTYSPQITAGRPTCGLGFAKHVVTSARPGYNYEDFYQTELDKKHKDKSYRVRPSPAPAPRPSS